MSSSSPKIFFVEGIRHSAVVLAASEEEAVRLATTNSSETANPAVLFGGVDGWEFPKATELRLPSGYALVQTKG
jgi:hypothetical protein